MPHEKKEHTKLKTLLSLGGTRYDKGIDILLNALKDVQDNFKLIIAGKEEFFSREYIEKKIESYRSKVELNLKFLSNEEIIFLEELKKNKLISNLILDDPKRTADLVKKKIG